MESDFIEFSLIWLLTVEIVGLWHNLCSSNQVGVSNCPMYIALSKVMYKSGHPKKQDICILWQCAWFSLSVSVAIYISKTRLFWTPWLLTSSFITVRGTFTWRWKRTLRQHKMVIRPISSLLDCCIEPLHYLDHLYRHNAHNDKYRWSGWATKYLQPGPNRGTHWLTPDKARMWR